MAPGPRPGVVIRYSYLWYSQAAKGWEEGVKDRPCAIVLASQKENVNTVVPITYVSPENLDEAIEIPIRIKQRPGLDSETSWIISSVLSSQGLTPTAYFTRSTRSL